MGKRFILVHSSQAQAIKMWVVTEAGTRGSCHIPFAVRKQGVKSVGASCLYPHSCLSPKPG